MENLDFLKYIPDVKKYSQKKREAIQEIYEKCVDGKMYQPIYTSLEGLLNKIYIHLTFNCPLRCEYCYADGGIRKSTELSANVISKIFIEAIEVGFKKIVVTGGEPLVYHDIDNLFCLMESIDRGKTAFVLRSSFAFQISDEKMEKLCSLFDEIVVSIDGDEQRHDSIRGKGTFEITTANVKRALKTGQCRVKLSAVMTHDELNSEIGEAFKSVASELEVDNYTISAPKPIGRAAKQGSFGFQYREKKDIFSIPKMKYSCGLGKNIYVEPDGTVFPCYAVCANEDCLGNLSKESLRTIVEDGRLLKYLNMGVDTVEKCQKCEVRYFCGGICKAYIKNGEFDCSAKKSHYIDVLKNEKIIQ